MDQHVTRFHRAAPFIACLHIAATKYYRGKRRIVTMPAESLASAMALMTHIRLCE